MKKRLLLLALPFALIATACVQGAGAVNPAAPAPIQASPQATVPGSVTPPTATATVAPANDERPSSDGQSVAVITIPGPSAPVPVAQPTATSVPQPAQNQPAPEPTATTAPPPTQMPARHDPQATPTPLWSTPPQIVPTSTPTPIVTPTPQWVPPTVATAAPGEQFLPLLNLQYELPAGWTQTRTDSAIVLTDSTTRAQVFITERIIEPWRFPTVLSLAVQEVPMQPEGWDEWRPVSNYKIKNGNAYEFKYDGIKYGHPYVNLVDWYTWGDVHIQVSVEVAEYYYSADFGMQREINDLLDSFEPSDGSRLFDEVEVLLLIDERLDDRASGVYARDEVIKARYELTCQQIMTDVPVELYHLGAGIWQFSALLPTGTEAWRIYEPAGSIVALDANEGRC